MTAKKKKPEREPMEGNDACICMHTALRKMCDSPITSAAYNLIHLICNMRFDPEEFDPWRLYGRVVAESLDATRKSTDARLGVICKMGVTKLEEAFREMETKRRETRGRDGNAPENAREALYALTSVFKCFDRDDWERMASYLGEQE